MVYKKHCWPASFSMCLLWQPQSLSPPWTDESGDMYQTIHTKAFEGAIWAWKCHIRKESNFAFSVISYTSVICQNTCDTYTTWWHECDTYYFEVPDFQPSRPESAVQNERKPKIFLTFLERMVGTSTKFEDLGFLGSGSSCLACLVALKRVLIGLTKLHRKTLSNFTAQRSDPHFCNIGAGTAGTGLKSNGLAFWTLSQFSFHHIHFQQFCSPPCIWFTHFQGSFHSFHSESLISLWFEHFSTNDFSSACGKDDRLRDHAPSLLRIQKCCENAQQIDFNDANDAPTTLQLKDNIY